ncbi:MAG: MFS transporter [Anaerolineae bacterium]
MTVSIVALGEFGVILVLSIYYQLAKGLGAFETGLQLIPLSLAMLITAPTAGVLSSRFGAKWVVTAGMALEAVGLFWISRIIPDADAPLQFPLIVYGIGLGLAIAQLANVVLSDIPSNKAGAASGANNTLRQLGASLGIAIIGAVLFSTFATATKPLVTEMTAFEDFSARVSANTEISNGARLLGSQFGQFSATAKEAINKGLDDNEGFDTSSDPLDTAIAQMPDVAKTFLKIQGVDLDNAETVAQIKADLAPDVEILQTDIRNALGTGFAQAAQSAALLSAIFVGLGAISSMLIPNAKARHDGEAVMAH